MKNATLIKRIMRMSPHELLVFILNWPEYLSDAYYSEFDTAIRKRAAELNLAPEEKAP